MPNNKGYSEVKYSTTPMVEQARRIIRASGVEEKAMGSAISPIQQSRVGDLTPLNRVEWAGGESGN